ncbi:MAG: FtsX-like permease family protein [Roseivirga sp.]|nr:FtsX-like permease family protein [Roseivirga sp.]
MFSLFQMNFKLAMRNLVRHKVFSAVNIFGLAGALCVSLFMVNMIYTGLNIDSHHADADRIHRIINHVTSSNRGKQLYASMPFRAVELLKEDIPDFEAVSHIKAGFRGSFKINGVEVLMKGIKVDSSFFDMFNLQMISGNPLAIFSDINSVIITNEVANRYFPGEDPIGKQTEEGFVVKAVMAYPKHKSHFQFEIIGPLEQFGAGRTSKNAYKHNLAHYYSDYAYVKLREGISPETLDSKLGPFSEKINTLKDYDKLSYRFVSQPLRDIIFGEIIYNEPGLMVGSDGLVTFLVLITVMLLMAGFNYTNLSIARATQRTKEIGIRKVSGSSNVQIILQILCETMTLSFFSLLIGLSFYKFFSDDFMALLPSMSKIFDPQLDLTIILIFVAFTFVTGVVAGIFPSFFFAKINPLSLFNPRVKHKKLSFLTMRKVLVTLQLTLSMFCIMLMFLLQQQVVLLKTSPKGFETEGRFIVRTDLAKATLLKSAFSGVQGVDAVTLTSDIPGEITNGFTSFFDPVDNDTTLIVLSFWADETFHEVINPKLLDGRYFSPDIIDGLHKEVLVNEKLLNLINISLEKAVGTSLKNRSSEYKIVGVLDGMNGNNPLMGTDQPVMIVSGKAQQNQSILLIKVNMKALPNTMTGLEAAWKELHPEDRFLPEALEDHLQKPMAEFENIIKVLRFLAFTIIAISLLGQLGIALYNAETRVKEIGIRKVLGARIESIIRLLLKGTIIPILIASAIAGPLAHLLFSQGIAASFRNPLRPGPWLFIQGILLLASIILFVVVSQTWRVARLNPTESLRNE